MSSAPESGHEAFEAPTRNQLEAQLRELQEELDRQVYQQNAAAACIELLQAEVEKLESPTVGGFMASLLGTKPGKLDALRNQSAAMEAEGAACAQAIDALQQQIADLDAALAAMPEDEETAGSTDAAALSETARDLERALDEGETLLNNLTGMSRTCGKLRHGYSVFNGAGAILAAVASTTRNRAANSLTGQIADSVSHFHARLESLQLDPVSEDAEILAATAQLARFTNASILEGNWAELEVLAGSLVADLREKLKRA